MTVRPVYRQHRFDNSRRYHRRFHKPDARGYVIALYLGVHLVEGYVLVPMVQRRAVHLPPALTLSAQVVLGFLAGFIGLLFATPLVAAGIVMVRMIYVEGILVDHESGEPAPFEAR